LTLSAADAAKHAAAAAAATEVESGMVLGLGTGTTAALALRAVAARILREGLRVVGIPTSERTAALAGELGIPLGDLARHRAVDLTIDGADEVERGTLDLIKGLGGALLREKIVAAASRRLVIVVDEGKLSDRLGTLAPVPVELVPFGHELLLDRLAELGGAAPVLRRADDGTPFVSDGGHYIADCCFGPIAEAARLDGRVRALVGVVESGLFLGMAARVIVGSADGTRILDR
jgi:ribose 5-phosphate isomerase A